MNSKIRPIDLGFVNAYLLEADDGFILVDTGVVQSRAALEAALADAGCLPGKLRLLVLTHGDVDHTGNAAYIQRRYQTKTAIHRGDAAMVENGEQPKRTVTLPIMRLITATGGRASRAPEAFTPDILLEDGQLLSEYGFDAKVVHLPGHTAGSCALLCGEDLIAGDVFSAFRKPGLSPFVENFDDYRRSLERIRGFGVKAVLPGHGKTFDYALVRDKIL
ncbi:MAG: MBL fold metallo-hydrolase [Clostridia bacterium]|nr:MBL fold metallo-hydrolase [Clostridia bacterium]